MRLLPLPSAASCNVPHPLSGPPCCVPSCSFVALEQHMNKAGVTTFYDSVCGIPLFRAPMNRTFAAFLADTTEHGWPSFRPAELVAGNVLPVDANGFIYSKCGTHLGSFLPDAQGARWCLDISCLAGNPAKPYASTQ